jgi:hypothetical protein
MDIYQNLHNKHMLEMHSPYLHTIFSGTANPSGAPEFTYQRGSQNPHIEEKQTTQWPKEKTKERSTKHTHKTKDRVTRTPLKTGGELRCSGRVSSS